MLTDFQYEDLCSRRDRAFATHQGASQLFHAVSAHLPAEAFAQAQAQVAGLKREFEALNAVQRAAFADRYEGQRQSLSQLAA